MWWRIPLGLVLAALTFAETRAADGDDADEFADSVETCLRYNDHIADARAYCFKSMAVTQIYSDLQTAALDRLFAGFEDDYPAIGDGKRGHLIAAAKHWKDFARPGPESREYMLQFTAPMATAPAPSNTVARLRRARGESVDVQIGHFLQGKIDFERDLQPLYPLDPRAFYAALKKRAPVEPFLAALSLEEMTTDAASCPAVHEAVTSLARVNIPLPAQLKTPQQPGAVGAMGVVLHPHVVVLRVPDFPIWLTVTDASMNTDVYRWVDKSAQTLEGCWRPAGDKPAAPP